MKHFIKYIALFVFAVSVFSCAKETHQKLVGRWKLYQSTPQAYNEFWTFTETNVTRTFEYPDTTTVENTGTYEVKTATKMTISGLGSDMKGVDYFRGDWTIRDIDSQGMVLYRHDAGAIYYEFSKQ